jgi:23S rRNA (pseudouridine1915-N3)-methyltransferase
MKIKFIVIGKTNRDFLVSGEKEFAKRLKHYCKFEEILISEVKNGGKLTREELKIKEGKLILSKLNSNEEIILLDNNGKSYSSKGLSKFIHQKMLTSAKPIAFIVGGAYGFSEEVYSIANSQLSLSKMTFSHQMVRLIFKEQLYRAFTIIKGEKYHHE